jgi:hypothetical protein
VFDNVEAIEGYAKVDAVLRDVSTVTDGLRRGSLLTKIICVTNEFLIPVPAKTTVP